MTQPQFPPVPGRPDPPFVANEPAMLEAWIEFHRTTLLWKCADLSEEQLKMRSVPPSSMSLLGLVRHMTEVERSWYARCFAGRDSPPLYYSDADPDGDFDTLDSAPVIDVFADFRRAVDESRAIAAGVDPDAISAAPKHGEHVSMRWIQIHLIEEYARHNGHADFLRECIDGVTGD